MDVLSGPAQRTVIDVLMAPSQRLRLKRLFIQYSSKKQESIPLFLSAGLTFPALEDLEVKKYGQTSLALLLQAPSLLRLVLSGSNFELSVPLIVSSLVSVSVVGEPNESAARLLATILCQCPALEHLKWNAPCAALTTCTAKQRPLVPLLKTLRIGGSGDSPHNVLRLLHEDRGHVEPVLDMTVEVYEGMDIVGETLELLQQVFYGTGSLLDLRVDVTEQKVVYTWDLPGLWGALATHFAIDRSLQSLRMRTIEWNLFATGFSQHPPTRLSQVHILLCGGLSSIWDTDSSPHQTCTLSIPNLRRIVLLQSFDSVPVVTRVREILSHIECEVSIRVEVCVFRTRTPATLLDGLADKWILCTNCAHV
ncbi:hypothetical protein EXIGLDRAFT_760855 [Exidia glandulosa HHB12029]|uniref:F-box domain-containing protein n=1 Tax=Exidia glandulosa HHB12029 TaxID=1314781 RepID=A0A165NXF4_EXIGL|nr:hypothetical protein EXIGLDRAFT_760855 [Exidia glandulosa HHB12029]